MNPFKLVKDAEPDGTVDRSLIFQAKDELMKEIASENLENSEMNQHNMLVKDRKSHDRVRSPLALVAEVLAVVLVAGAALFGLRGDDSFDVANVADQTVEQTGSESEGESVQNTDVKDLSSQSVAFSVESLQVDVGGDKIYSPKSDSFGAYSRLGALGLVAGDSNAESDLDMEWLEPNSSGEEVAMRVEFDFAKNAENWWVREIRTYDGRFGGDWLYAEGEFFKTAIGDKFSGDISIAVDGSSESGEKTTGTLNIVGAELGLLQRDDICADNEGLSLLVDVPSDGLNLYA